MPRSGSPHPRRRRGRRHWVTVDGAPVSGPAAGTPAADAPTERDYTPRRRYPWHDDPDYDPTAHRRVPGPLPASWPPVDAPGPTGTRAEPTEQADPIAEIPWSEAGPPPAPGARDDDRPATRMPRKLTVTRVAALRSRQLTENGIRAFRRAATADGADRSGLTALTYATMMTYAVDAAVAVALANTLFFAAATAESKTNVALYLAITVAPFAVVAPVIGPLLDRIQRGRRAALAASFAGRAVLAVVMAYQYDSWLLYPAALGVMVLSKSYQVLKAAVTPRVLPPSITLVTTNSRLTAFGLASGAVFGGVAAGVAALSGSPGALWFTSGCAVAGALLCLRIPRWVESTAGEVPAALRSTARGRRRPMGRGVLVALWGAGTVRVFTGFLTLFVAFVVKAVAEEDPAGQLFLIGLVGAAAGLGSFVGNAIGSRQRFGGGSGRDRAEKIILTCVAVTVAAAAAGALLPGIATATVVALVAAGCSASAKVCLDAVVQRDLPEESRASAFGRSETVLQLAWVLGGALGVLLPHSTYWIGFTVVTGVLAAAGLQTLLLSRGRSLLPTGRRAAPPQPARSTG